MKTLDRVIMEVRLARKRMIQLSTEDEDLADDDLQVIQQFTTDLHKMLRFVKGMKESRKTKRPRQQSILQGEAEEAPDDGANIRRGKKGRDDSEQAAANG